MRARVLLDGADVTRLPVHARARAGLARSYQKNNLLPGLTVAENLSLAAATAQRRQGSLLGDSFAHRQVRETVAETAASVGLTGLLDAPVDAIAYGPRRQLEVGLALATRPRVLLMDEPTSGVGPEMVAAFHRLLHALPRALTVLIIEHDMDLAFDIADRVSVLNHGELVFEGSPDEARASARCCARSISGGWVRLMLELADLHAGYGETRVLHGLSLSVPQGRVTALLGRNGAGKTTTLRAVMGLVPRHRRHLGARRDGRSPARRRTVSRGSAWPMCRRRATSSRR